MSLWDSYLRGIESVQAAKQRGRNMLYGSPEEQEQKALGLMGSPGWEQSGPLQPGMERPQAGASGLLGSEMGFGDKAKYYLGMLGAGYNPQEALGALSLQQQQKPTTLMQNLQAAGVDLSSLSGQKAMLDAVMKPQTQINMGAKLPAGYQWTDPNDTSKGVVPIQGGPVTKATAAEAKQLSQADMSQSMLDEIRAGIDAGVNVSNPLLWAESEVAAMPVFSWMTNLSPDQAKVASNLRQFENQFLAMMRGAQVGPAEQKMFRKQLPQLGQSDELFEANFEASQKNLRIMAEKMRSLRNIAPPQQGLPVPPGWEEY